MNSPREDLSLREWQSRFAAALLANRHDDDSCQAFARLVVDDGIPALARLRVYRNNSRLVQIDALGRTYGVLRRRVGEAYFEGLAEEYRDACPSPRGDLHWIGAGFPSWLEARLAGSEYEWLADLARLEWACEEAVVAASGDALPLPALGAIAPEALPGLVIRLAPSVRLVRSQWPVWSVWRENQPDAPGAPVDLSQGAEHVIVACVDGGLVLLAVAAREWRFVAELQDGQRLGEALERSQLAVEDLAPSLGRLFGERLVSGLDAPAPHPSS